MLDSVRLWQLFVPLYVVPILSVLVGLTLFMLLENLSTNLPRRMIRVDNSGVLRDKQLLFWADFGSHVSGLDFSVSFYLNYYYR